MMGGHGARRVHGAVRRRARTTSRSAPGYAANVEVATADAAAGRSCPRGARRAGGGADARDDDDRGGRRRSSGVAGGRAAEGVPGGRRATAAMRAGRRPRRPPRQRDQARESRSARRFAPARPRGDRGAASGRPASSGRSARRCRSCSTRRSSPGPAGYVAGANRPDAHLRGVEPGRDFAFEPVDVREVVAGDTVGGARSGSSRRSRSATSSSSGRATPSRSAPRYLDETGKPQLIWMGSYGFGPARAAAAAVEQFADEQRDLVAARDRARSTSQLVTLGKPGSEERALADALYDELPGAGLDDALRRPRRRPGREVRRRRAARLSRCG